MRLTRIEIEGFGTLQGMDLRFGPTMNLVVGPNEAGKSTLQPRSRKSTWRGPTGRIGTDPHKACWTGFARIEPSAWGSHADVRVGSTTWKAGSGTWSGKSPRPARLGAPSTNWHRSARPC